MGENTFPFKRYEPSFQGEAQGYLLVVTIYNISKTNIYKPQISKPKLENHENGNDEKRYEKTRKHL